MRRLTEREVTTILASLRAFQGGEHLDELQEHFRHFEPLSDEEVEGLYEELNAKDTVLTDNSEYIEELVALCSTEHLFASQHADKAERIRQLVQHIQQDPKHETKLPEAIEFMDRLESIIENLDPEEFYQGHWTVDTMEDIEGLVRDWVKIRPKKREAVGLADSGQVYCPTCREETELNLIEDALAFWPVYGISRERKCGTCGEPEDHPADEHDPTHVEYHPFQTQHNLAVGPSDIDLESARNARIECLECNGSFDLPVGVSGIEWCASDEEVCQAYVLTDGEEIMERRRMTPKEAEEANQDAASYTAGNLTWVLEHKGGGTNG